MFRDIGLLVAEKKVVRGCVFHYGRDGHTQEDTPTNNFGGNL